MTETRQYTNHLAGETSPYLLQHLHMAPLPWRSPTWKQAARRWPASAAAPPAHPPLTAPRPCIHSCDSHSP